MIFTVLFDIINIGDTMNMFIPDMYKKDVFSINYEELKAKGIKVLLFDFDNTLIEKGNYDIKDKTIKLFENLKKTFKVYIVSNSIHGRKLRKICDELNTSYIKGSIKPFKRGFKKLDLKVKPEQIAMIGDQVLTDVLGSKRMNYFSVLIDPINYDEWLLTRLNRVVENIIMKKNKMKRGSYYD